MRFRLLLFTSFLLPFQEIPTVTIYGISFAPYQFAAFMLFFVQIAELSLSYKRTLIIDKEILLLIISFLILGVASYLVGVIRLLNTELSESLLMYNLRSWYVISQYIITISFLSELHFYRGNREALEMIGKIVVLSFILSCLFSWYASFGVLVVGLPYLIPGFIDSSGELSLRARGFTTEASVFAVQLTWALLIVFLLGKRIGKFVPTVLLISTTLLTTFSSSLIISMIFFAIWVAHIYSYRHVIYYIAVIIVTSGVIVYAYELEFIIYMFYYKILNYLSVSDVLHDSGSFRSFTSAIGFQIIRDYPLFGVGPGGSQMYLFEYAQENFIQGTTDTMSVRETTPIQNGLIQYGAEQGIVALILFIIFLFSGVKRGEPFTSNVFIGSISILAVIFFLLVYPVYNMYYIFYPFLAQLLYKSRLVTFYRVRD